MEAKSLSNFHVIRAARDKEHPFLVVNKSYLFNTNLSLEAKGLLTIVFGLPEKWDFNIPGMVKLTGKSKNTVYKLINELIEQKYCNKIQQNDGKFGTVYYYFLETPDTPLPKNWKTLDVALPKNWETDNKAKIDDETPIDREFVPLPNLPQAEKGTQLNNNSNRINNNSNKIKKFSFSKSLKDLVDDEALIDEWMVIRKKKQAVNTERSLAMFLKEVEKSGKPLKEVLEIIVGKQWKGFEAEWLSKNTFTTKSAPTNKIQIETQIRKV